MAANRTDVDRWIHQAKKQKCSYIISVCDTFDWDDYPVYCKNKEEVHEKFSRFDCTNMQRVNEIIKINDDGSVVENLNFHNL